MLINTVNHEYFVVKIFSDSLAYAKIKRREYMCNINHNVVQGCLSENYLTLKATFCLIQMYKHNYIKIKTKTSIFLM